ncbi:MAG TPA: nucleoside monophosphate kinase [Pyrinomonadaceae bacterium]|nr:nucleoside monophosphate kinase [Pyrinomonadaceae bacterium]
MSKTIVLIGAPGAGKGTQARLLQKRLNLPQISTGDILRARADAGDPLAEEIRALQAAGKLAPDDLVIRVVEERTAQDDCKNGYVLDGFPRTLAQAQMLEKLTTEQQSKLIAIAIDVPFDVLEKRTTGRRHCPVCGEIYNMYFKPPKSDETCDRDAGVRLVLRADDSIDKVRVRLETYEKQTQPVLEYYGGSRRLHSVDGVRDRESIYQDIEKIIRES